MKDGHQTYCKPCSYALAKESAAKYEEAARLRWAERLARTPAPSAVKACGKCGETKPLLSFYAHRTTSDGRANYCMECQKAASREWRKNNADRVKANNARQQTDAKLKRAKRGAHRRWWLALYGLNVEQYETLLAEQGGVCAICLKPESYIDSRTGNPRRLSVDHDHATGKVRGLLCGRCNRMLGYINDDADALDRGAAYLRQD